MNDQELHDIFHSYRPEMSREEDFMARLNEQMDAIDANQRGRRLKLFLPWISGIAAAVAVGLFLFKPAKSTEPQMAAFYPYYPERITILTMDSDPFSSYEETVAEIERSGQQLQLAIAEMKK